jgi:hypothetical protein
VSNQVQIILGNEIKFQDIIQRYKSEKIDQSEAYELIALRIKENFDKMKKDLKDYKNLSNKY